MMRGLPPGFRFEPTEEELVFEYLKCKVFSSALPASIIPEINGVWNLDPWDIPSAGGEEDKYLFSNKELYNVNNRGIVGWSRNGYWKVRERTGREKQIVSSDNGIAFVGMKKTLDFYRTNNNTKTGWVMNQYRLIFSNNVIHLDLEINKWVLCHIKLFNNNHHAHAPLHSSTNHHQIQDQHHNHTAFSDDDDDSLSSTASSSSTDFTSPATTTTVMGF